MSRHATVGEVVCLSEQDGGQAGGMLSAEKRRDPPCSTEQSAGVWAITERTRQDQLWGSRRSGMGSS